jgi:hypothetical protein
MSMSVIFWRIGMMDCWSSGIMGIKIGNNRFFVFLLTSSFQYSIIPVFQSGQSPEFLCDKQVTEILPIKVKRFPA